MQPRQHAVHARHAVLRHRLQDAAEDVQRGLGGLRTGQGVQSAQGDDLRARSIKVCCPDMSTG